MLYRALHPVSHLSVVSNNSPKKNTQADGRQARRYMLHTRMISAYMYIFLILVSNCMYACVVLFQIHVSLPLFMQRPD